MLLKELQNSQDYTLYFKDMATSCTYYCTNIGGILIIKETTGTKSIIIDSNTIEVTRISAQLIINHSTVISTCIWDESFGEPDVIKYLQEEAEKWG